jgi:hypothetical protein
MDDYDCKATNYYSHGDMYLLCELIVLVFVLSSKHCIESQCKKIHKFTARKETTSDSHTVLIRIFHQQQQ